MIERAVLACGVLALLVPGVVQTSTPEELLDELGRSPGVNVTQVNETAYLFVLLHVGDSSAVPNQLTADGCGSNSGYACNCPGSCPHLLGMCPESF